MNLDETVHTVSLHGLGFLQVKLHGDQRLHIWHPDLPRRECFEHSQVHNHRFSFVSTVLVGEMTNIDYEVRERPMQLATHIAYAHEGERGEHGNRPWTPAAYVSVEEVFRRTVKAGEGYRIGMFEYHATQPEGDGRVATVMRKIRSDKYTGARSICAREVEPDAGFDRQQLSQKYMWQIVVDVLSDGTYI